MKLPKGFGGAGFGGMMQQAQAAMARAQNLEDELKKESFEVNKGPVKAMYNGVGEILGIKIDKSVVDPEDVEALEDLILGCIRDGYTKAVEIRQERTQEILKGMPNIPGLNI